MSDPIDISRHVTPRATDELRQAFDALYLCVDHINKLNKELVAMGWGAYRDEIYQDLYDTRYRLFALLVAVDTTFKEATHV